MSHVCQVCSLLSTTNTEQTKQWVIKNKRIIIELLFYWLTINHWIGRTLKNLNNEKSTPKIKFIAYHSSRTENMMTETKNTEEKLRIS